MLMRFDAFRDLDRLVQQAVGGAPSWASVLPMDAYRRGDTFFVHVDVPGVDADAIELTVEKNVLTVRAERSWAPAEDDELLVTERHQGTFSRQLFLGEGLDADGIQASYENGVLTVTIPVAEQARPRKVSISRGDDAAQPVEAHAKTH